MQLIVFTKSDSFKNYIAGLPGLSVDFYSQWASFSGTNQDCLVHHSTMGLETEEWVKNQVLHEGRNVGVCSDQPNINDMLQFVKLGAHAYCNSFMRTAHYLQLIRMLSQGQSWFPPEMMVQTFELAHRAVHGRNIELLLKPLTTREKDIASAVSEGLSNKEIASKVSIAEPTVKTHLTNIFKKLQLKDRVELVLYLKQG